MANEPRDSADAPSPARARARLQIGAVTYLNSRPLTVALPDTLPSAAVWYDHPSRLAAELVDGEADVALIPSIEAFRLAGSQIVSDACVASEGAVLSVKLFSRVPFARLSRLALDAGSRTSAALTRILLRERYDVDPIIDLLPFDQPLGAVEADAALLIGDRGMTTRDARFPYVLDLGQAWTECTGLPMVFAMWTARANQGGEGLPLDGPRFAELAAALAAARDLGVERIESIALAAAPRVGLSVEQCRAYLRDHLRFRLGARERKGLLRFYESAVRHELAPAGVDLVFHTPSA